MSKGETGHETRDTGVKASSRIYHLMFLSLLIGIFAYKFNDLFLPYFWDELGVYFQCAYYQYTHGLSLMPSSVPADFSRGHPLLFTFLNASIFKIFGPSVVCVHLFNLSVAIALLVVLYLNVTKYFGPLAAIISCVFLACQPVFLAQSCFVLPEIMLALLAFCALLFFYEGKYLGFAIFSSMAMLTKETAIILPATVIIYSLFRFRFTFQKSGLLKPVNILLVISPYIIFGAFLLLQKNQNGWYFFPYHVEKLFTTLSDYWYQSQRFLQFLFLDQGKRFWLYAGIAALIFTVYKNGFRMNPLGQLLAIFIILFLLFSSLNFYMERYLIIALVPLSVMMGSLLANLGRNKIFISALVIGLCAKSLCYLQADHFNYDADLGYRKTVRVLKAAIDYTSKIAGNETVAANFPGYFAINSPGDGYLGKEKINAVGYLNGRPGYYLYSIPNDLKPPDTSNYKVSVVQTFKDGFAEETLYKLDLK